MEDILVPLGVFAMVAAIVGFNAWASTAKRKQVMETVRDAVRAGQQLDPQTIKALGAQQKPKGGDLKSGMILIAVAAAFVTLGFALSSAEMAAEPGLFMVMASIAAFPGFIGIVLVLFGLFNRKRDED